MSDLKNQRAILIQKLFDAENALRDYEKLESNRAFSFAIGFLNEIIFMLRKLNDEEK